jgi:hypothetical protein
MKNTAILAGFLIFALGVLAGPTIAPNGWSWNQIPPPRQLGYLEGFNDGSQFQMMTQIPCKNASPTYAATEDCVLYRLHMASLAGPDSDRVLSTLNKFYEQSENKPVHWDHAIVISEALVSGVHVDEKDLEVIRLADAKGR